MTVFEVEQVVAKVYICIIAMPRDESLAHCPHVKRPSSVWRHGQGDYALVVPSDRHGFAALQIQLEKAYRGIAVIADVYGVIPRLDPLLWPLLRCRKKEGVLILPPGYEDNENCLASDLFRERFYVPALKLVFPWLPGFIFSRNRFLM
jgi:hypothetical protein